ncbi:hypothetical protein A3H12_01655 [Candidatus Uhrbacteria bacterium RIFCSPLOWO2_12_FULL_47_9]|nr:MAG: hypothetical protein A3H12_01655 [Candidatus Uhrbacteria bacterium RIFCSPLOWO2_12_FULL_47_9]
MANKPLPVLVDIPHKGFVILERWLKPGNRFLNELIRTTDSVAGVLHDVVNERILLIRQDHVAAMSDENPHGTLVTPFAGRFDVKLSPKQLLIKEAMEEVGVDLTEDDIEMLNFGQSMVLSIGVLTERAYLCYAEVRPEQLTGKDDDVRSAEGENEGITRHWVSTKDLETFVCDDLRVLAFIQYIRLKLLERKIVRLNEVIDHSCDCEGVSSDDAAYPFEDERGDDDMDGEEHGVEMD